MEEEKLVKCLCPCCEKVFEKSFQETVLYGKDAERLLESVFKEPTKASIERNKRASELLKKAKRG